MELNARPTVLLQPQFKSDVFIYQTTVSFDAMVLQLWGKASTCQSDVRINTKYEEDSQWVNVYHCNSMCCYIRRKGYFSEIRRCELPTFDMSLLSCKYLTLKRRGRGVQRRKGITGRHSTSKQASVFTCAQYKWDCLSRIGLFSHNNIPCQQRLTSGTNP